MRLEFAIPAGSIIGSRAPAAVFGMRNGSMRVCSRAARARLPRRSFPHARKERGVAGCAEDLSAER